MGKQQKCAGYITMTSPHCVWEPAGTQTLITDVSQPSVRQRLSFDSLILIDKYEQGHRRLRELCVLDSNAYRDGSAEQHDCW